MKERCIIPQLKAQPDPGNKSIFLLTEAEIGRDSRLAALEDETKNDHYAVFLKK